LSSAALQPTTDPAESLVRIVEGLCEAIAARFEKDLPASPIKRLAWAQLRHLAGWFAALMAEFRAGLLAAAPASRRPAPAAPALSRTPAVPPHFLRRGLGCLLRLMPGRVAFGRAVQNWLFGPEIGGAACSVAASSPQPQPAGPDVGDPAGAGALCAAMRSSALPVAKPNPGPAPLASSPIATPDSGYAAILASVRAVAPGRRPPIAPPQPRAAGVWSVFTAAAVSAGDPPTSFLRDGPSATANARL
jgi:hypothetical protein